MKLTEHEELNALRAENRRLRLANEEYSAMVKVLRDDLARVEYAFRGACAANLAMNISVSPIELAEARDVSGLYRAVIRNAAKAIAHEVEERLGSRHDLMRELHDLRRFAPTGYSTGSSQ